MIVLVYLREILKRHVFKSCLSVCQQEGSSVVTFTYNALDLIVQAPPHLGHGIQPVLTSGDQNWKSFQTCSLQYPPTPTLLNSGDQD